MLLVFSDACKCMNAVLCGKPKRIVEIPNGSASQLHCLQASHMFGVADTLNCKKSVLLRELGS